jgi:Holliday junction resolvase RusA-like endonuclease
VFDANASEWQRLIEGAGMREFTVHHEPVGQPRHRISTHGKHARMYLPTKHPVHAFKRAVQAEFGKRLPFHEAVEIVVNAWFPRPKSKTWKTRPMPSYRHIKKPDADNVLKAVLDALNGLAWVDDAQVFSATVRKFVCSGECVPRCEIVIRGVSE